ncbi:MAG: DEAD/DEAH box helicase [Bacteroidota bacterium]
MSLSHLIKHIYNNASDEVIRRGKKIHHAGNIEVIDHNPLMQTISYRVKDDMYNTWYKIKIDNYNDPRGMVMRCTCPYNITEVCRHKVAALLNLQDKSDNGSLEGREVRYNQRHTQVKIKLIDLKMIRMLAGNENYEQALELLRSHTATILSATNETVEAELPFEGETFRIRLRKNEERFFDTSCTCHDEEHVLCIHKTALFLQLLNAYGINYFDTIRNYDRDKEKLLGLYGYSLKDDLKGKFEFVYKEGKPFLKVLDPNIKRVASPTQAPPPPSYMQPAVQVPEPEIIISKKLGMVFRENEQAYPFFIIEAVQGDLSADNKITGKIEKLDLTRFVNLDVFSEEDRQVVQQLRKLTDSEINKFLNRNSPFSGIWENIVHTNGSELPEETRQLINDYMQPKLQRMISEQHQNAAAFVLPPGKKFISANLEPIQLSDISLRPYFLIQADNNDFVVRCQVEIEDETVPLDANEWISPVLFLYKGRMFGWEKAEDAGLAEFYRQPRKIPADAWGAFAEKNIIPLSKDYDVQFDKSLVREIRDVEPGVKIQLLEKGDFLVFQPIFTYHNIVAPYDEQSTLTMVQNGEILMLHRMADKERQFFNKLESLHTNFIRPERSRQLVLKGADVLKNNWFFLFMEAMHEMQIEVLGFDHLKNFRFNQAKPSTHIRISSGVDWFDAKVDVTFGDQQVRISDIKQALAGKQSVVPLNDGTLGILPEEWLKKYALLFRVGEGNTGSLRLSKYQFSVIDELYEQRDNDELQIELEEKFDRLRNFKKIKKVDPPKHLESILRPYQNTGFHWLNFLQETGCGGILADDMGLGKTIQALTMLEHFENKTGNLKALVVCPTTLLYNWENEIKKFTPNLEYFIHHGGQRSRDVNELLSHHIIITTYGTLRSDVIMLQQINFDYVVLDESQAIKNPNSKVAKASCLINSKHRLCMSGTPLQNNTFDIYAQMNFLNPGLLGNAEFFRNEFATPIDKFGEQEHKLHLRKLLFPFILRRTKEQVAKDLPEKVETILFCEMEDEQRRIYDAFRNDFRDKVLGTIDSQGMERSTLTILQGLMKLRQICDSPAIMNEPEKYPNHSIKLDELTREITENISDHKALVFSQFLGMLGLIKEKLTDLGVPFEYFDGSTSVTDRQKAIENFQNNSECRVFLISLKAGGVGLNLTAADYVYIVDPWWNPAVEQQAIDRTHRIGQTRNIFAYRMICKDTVEDKIIQLQERKKVLAKELIADDAGFVKRLTRDDIAYLFS